LEHALGSDDVRFVTLHDEIVAGGPDPHAEAGLEALEMLVEGPEEGLDALVGQRDRT